MRRRVAAALWFVALPSLATLLVFGALLPTSTEIAADGWAAPIVVLTERHAVPCAAALFVVFALLARYWAAFVPGSASWAPATKTAEAAPFRKHVTFAGIVFLAAASALFVRARVFASYRVLSASMLPALEPGDLVTVNKLAYGFRLVGGEPLFGERPVRRGDVVVLHAPGGAGAPEQLVKRVIGLPGDRIEMTAGHPVINGWRVPSCDAGIYLYLSADRSERGRLLVEFLDDQAYLTLHSPKHAAAESYLVPPGEVFVLGDHRNASADSRSFRRGKSAGIPLSAVEGRAARLLAGTRRDGRVDLGQFFQPFAFDLNLHGMDASALEAGIRRCLATRPNARPPARVPAADAKATEASD